MVVEIRSQTGNKVWTMVSHVWSRDINESYRMSIYMIPIIIIIIPVFPGFIRGVCI